MNTRRIRPKLTKQNRPGPVTTPIRGPQAPAPSSSLPPELQQMIGTECDCSDDCPPDPRISCQWDGNPEPAYVVTSYIQNARKGDLLLIPGGSSGVIGALLHKLIPPQHYTHMGIVTKNFYWIRHSCGIDDRLNAKEYATGSVFGTPAPLSGFDPEHLKFCWPGTVTQTVDQAYLANLPVDPNQSQSVQKFVPCSLTDQASIKTPKTAYNVNALSFDAIFDKQADPNVFKGAPSLGLPAGTVFPLVVKPCRVVETNLVRETLHQVADAAMSIFGHYRFYCYSDPTIALQGGGGPPCDMPNPNPIAAFPDSPDHWFPSNANSPTPTTVSVPFTFPTVCSSFAWLSVQKVSLPNFPYSHPGNPKIVLDASTVAPQPNEPKPILGCPNEVPPNWGEDPAGVSRDGLYIYDNASRQSAGSELHDKVRQMVIDTIQQSLPGPLLTLVQSFGITAVLAAAAAGGVPGIVALLGVDQISGANLYEALFDMPNDVANQLVNAFASDYCDESATDSDNWKNPGSISPDFLHVTPEDSRGVSPENTILWDAPSGTTLGPEKLPEIVGLYGYNEKAIFRTGTFPKYRCTWQPSNGTATLHGFVKSNGIGVNGAVVYVCCKETITHSGGIDQGQLPGFFSLTIPSGRYLARATFTAPNGWGLDGQTDTTFINPGQSYGIEIDLQNPPEQRRIITITGSMLLTDYYVGFSSPDQELYPFNCQPLYAEVVIKGPTPQDVFKNVTTAYASHNENMSDQGDDTSATLEVWIDAINYDEHNPANPSNLSIDGHWKFSLPDDNMSHLENFHIEKDGTYVAQWFLDTGGAFPDSAKINFTINNLRAP